MPTFTGRRVSTGSIIPSAPRPYTSTAGTTSLRAAPVSGDVGSTIAGLGKAFQNGTVNALRQEQMQKLADENQLRRMAAGNVNPDGTIADQAVGSFLAQVGAIDPTKYGRMQAIEGARLRGVDDPTVAAVLTGLGEYKNTPLYGERDFANKVQIQGMQEATKLRMNDAQEATKLRIADSSLETVQTPEGPKLVRRGQAVGMSPVLSTDQVRGATVQDLLPSASPAEKSRFAFGSQPAPDVYNATLEDGTTKPATVNGDGTIIDLNTKQPLTGVKTIGKLEATTSEGLSGDSGVGKDILAGRISTEQAVNLIDTLSSELDKPNAGVSIGFLGGLSEAANNIRSQVESGAKALGGLSAREELRAPEIAGSVDKVMQENAQLFTQLRQQGIDTAKIRSLIEDLAYAQAKANDPNGRMSNQDIERAGRQVGMGLGDPGAMKQVLTDLRERTINGQEIRERNSASFVKGKPIPQWESPILKNRRGRQAPAETPAPVGAPASAPSAASSMRQKYGLE